MEPKFESLSTVTTQKFEMQIHKWSNQLYTHPSDCGVNLFEVFLSYTAFILWRRSKMWSLFFSLEKQVKLPRGHFPFSTSDFLPLHSEKTSKAY